MTILLVCTVVKSILYKAGKAKWYAPPPPWLWLPDNASEHTCRRRPRDTEALLRPGGGGSGGALPETPGQKYHLNFLSACGKVIAVHENTAQI